MAARSGESTCSGTSRSPLLPEAAQGALSLPLCSQCLRDLLRNRARESGREELRVPRIDVLRPTEISTGSDSDRVLRPMETTRSLSLPVLISVGRKCRSRTVCSQSGPFHQRGCGEAAWATLYANGSSVGIQRARRHGAHEGASGYLLSDLL